MSQSAKIYASIQQLCANRALFQGRTSGWAIQTIRKTIEKCDEQRAFENLLNPGTDKGGARQKHANGDWSYGYCYIIAQVVKLILMGASPERAYLSLWGTKAANKRKSHWVLKSDFDGSFVDPEGQFLPEHYRRFKGKGFRRFPAARARLLFELVVDHCISSGDFDARQTETAKQTKLELERLWKLRGEAISTEIKAAKKRRKKSS